MKKFMAGALVLLSMIAVSSCGKGNDKPNDIEDTTTTEDYQKQLAEKKSSAKKSLNSKKANIYKKLGIYEKDELDTIIQTSLAKVEEADTIEKVDEALNECNQLLGQYYPQAVALVELDEFIQEANKKVGFSDAAQILEAKRIAEKEIVKYNTYEETKAVLDTCKNDVNSVISEIIANKELINELKTRSAYFSDRDLSKLSSLVTDFDLITEGTYRSNGVTTKYFFQWFLDEESDFVRLENNKLVVTRPSQGDEIQTTKLRGRIVSENNPNMYYDFYRNVNVVPENLTKEQVGQIAADNIYIPTDLSAVVNDINLPEKTYCNLTELNITWSVSSNATSNVSFSKYDPNTAQIEVIKASIKRPKVGEADIHTKLIATISGSYTVQTQNGKFDQAIVTKTVEYDMTILAEQPRKTYDFIEDFNNYEAGTSFADVRSPYWEYIEEQKRLSETTVVDKITNNQDVEINNTIEGNNALRCASNAVNEAKYDAFVSLPNSFVMETYFMSVDGGNNVNLDFRGNGSSVFSVGLKGQYLSFNGSATEYKLNDGVWYKIRLEYNNGQIALKCIDLINGTISNVKSASVTARTIDDFRISVPSLKSDGLTYISNINILDEIFVIIPDNPNRTIGIGELFDINQMEEVAFDDYVVVDKGSEYTLPEIAVYDRFNQTLKLQEGIDYTVTTTIKAENGNTVDNILTSTTGNYEVEYLIQLLDASYEPAEIRKEVRTISIQEIGAPSVINNLNVSVVRGGVVTVTGTLTRENNTLNYVLLDQENKNITAQDIMSNANVRTVNVETIDLNKALSAQVGKYLYFVIKADNEALSDVYSFTENGIVAPLTDVIKLSTADHVYALATNPDTAGDKFELTNDIDMTGVSWGQSAVVFTGTLDGKGYAIKNIKNKAADLAGGIFYSVSGTVKNIRFENCEIIASAECGLFGKESNGATFTNIDLVNVTVWGNNEINSTGYVGALVGRARGTGKTTRISKVSLINDNDHYIKSSRYTGGLLGGVENADVFISDCYIKSKLLDERQCTGGLVGRAKQGGSLMIERCLVRAEVISYKYAGLIIGENEVQGSRGTTIKNVAIAGTVNGGDTNKKNFGLIAGRLQGKFVTLSGLISLGARLEKNALDQAIDNSQDNLVMTLDTGVFTSGANEVCLEGLVNGQRFMSIQNTDSALNNENSCKTTLAFLDWDTVFEYVSPGEIRIRH